jgi:hypothetical protein
MTRTAYQIAILAAWAALAACSADADSSSPSGSGNNQFGNTPAAGAGAGVAGTGSTAGSGSGSAGLGGDGIGQGCATADIQAARVTPTIWLVVDGSGSMDEGFGGTSRWTALREALMAAQGGVVPTLQAAVVWGLVEYDGPIDIGSFLPGLFGGGAGTGGAGECPRLVVVEPALNNFTAMDAAYPQQPLGGSTPTHKALDAVATRLTGQPVVLDQNIGPTYVVLATDGQPNDFCANASPDAAAAVLQSATSIAATGTKMFVISLAGNDAALQAHLEQVAMIGNTGKPPFTPMNKDDLVKTFEEIIGGAVGCEVRLNGKVMLGSECQGYVKVNGNNLLCNDANGWRLKDEQTVELTGTACDAFKGDNMAQLIANFPCGVFVPD